MKRLKKSRVITGVAWYAKGRNGIPFCVPGTTFSVGIYARSFVRSFFLCVGPFSTVLPFVCSAVLLACLYVSSFSVVTRWLSWEDEAGLQGYIRSLTTCNHATQANTEQH